MVDEQHGSFFQLGRSRCSGAGGAVSKRWRLARQRGPAGPCSPGGWTGSRLGAAFARVDLGLWLAALGAYLVAQVVSSRALADCWPALLGFDGRPGPLHSPTTSSACSSTWSCRPPWAATWCAPGTWPTSDGPSPPPAGGRRRSSACWPTASAACWCWWCWPAWPRPVCPVPLPAWIAVARRRPGGRRLAGGLACLPLLPRLLDAERLPGFRFDEAAAAAWTRAGTCVRRPRLHGVR